MNQYTKVEFTGKFNLNTLTYVGWTNWPKEVNETDSIIQKVAMCNIVIRKDTGEIIKNRFGKNLEELLDYLIFRKEEE